MEKEKQIEEMARVLCQNQCYSCTGATCLALLNCKALYEHGYRKITENEVVISKEEYRKLKLKRKNAMAIETARKVCEHIENDNKKIRKETAREILRPLYLLTRKNSCGIALISVESVEELAKHFGVEIGEEE